MCVNVCPYVYVCVYVCLCTSVCTPDPHQRARRVRFSCLFLLHLILISERGALQRVQQVRVDVRRCLRQQSLVHTAPMCVYVCVCVCMCVYVCVCVFLCVSPSLVLTPPMCGPSCVLICVNVGFRV
jgi:hypothetical protein